MKKLLGFLILLGLGLIGGAFWLNHGYRTTPEGQFTTVPLERGEIAEIINATGILQPREVTAVGSVVSGEVVKIYPGADFNKFVEKDQPLLELDSRVAKLKRDQAAITVNLARADVEKAGYARQAADAGLKLARENFAKALVQQGVLNQAKFTFQTAEAALKTAQIKVLEAEEGLKAAELGLELTTVRAPAAGVIIDRKVVLGQLVAPPASAQLFLIASDLSKMQLNAQVAEGDIGRVGRDLKASFSVYAYSQGNDDRFEGTVAEIRPMATSVQGAVFYTTVINAQNRKVSGAKDADEWMLRPGMTATVDIQRRKHENALKLPNAALNFQLDEHYQTPEAKAKLKDLERLKNPDEWRYVWVVKDQKPWPVFVRTGGTNAQGKTGIKDGQFTEVLEWDPQEPRPDLRSEAGALQVIIAAPPATKPGLFDRPSGLKFS